MNKEIFANLSVLKSDRTIIFHCKKLIVQKLDRKGSAKNSGFQTGDIISNFKIENLERPNKIIVYPFALLMLLIFGYINYKRKS